MALMIVVGSILLCATAILVSIALIWLSDLKKAAVGRRLVSTSRNCFQIVANHDGLQRVSDIPRQLYFDLNLRNFHYWWLSAKF